MALDDIRMIVLEPGSDRIVTLDGSGGHVETLRSGIGKFPDGIGIDPGMSAIRRCGVSASRWTRRNGYAGASTPGSAKCC